MADVLTIPPFTIDMANEVIHRHGKEIRLRRKTFVLLRYLLDNRDRLLTKDELLDQVWPDTHVGEAVLKVNMSQLRKIFHECRGLEIATAHGRGYRVHLDDTQPANLSGATPIPETPGHRPLIGRTRELRVLREAFEAALCGQRQVVFVTGGPGIGKTALVQAFVARLDEFGALAGPASTPWVGQYQCLPVPGTAEPLRPVFSALAGMQPRQAIDAVAAFLSRFAPHLLDEAEEAAAGDREADESRSSRLSFSSLQNEPLSPPPEPLQDALVAELERLSAGRPVILVLEDLHWSDAQTCSVVASLFQRASPSHLLVIATHRPEDVATGHHPLGTVMGELHVAYPGRAHVVALDALDQAAVAQLVESYLGEAPPQLVSILFERSRGNPLFVDRLLTHLQASGALRREGTRWSFHAEGARRAAVPEELEHFIASQIDLLDRDARRILQAAAVAGTTFMTQDVAAILGLAIEPVEAICDDLAHKHDLLEISGVKSRSDGVVGTEYQFRHPLFQSVLYERLPPVLRQSFHARLGAQLEQSYGEAAVLNAHELARHFERGGNPERTMHYLRVAAHVAVRRGMPGDAREYLREVVRLLEATQESSGRLEVATELARLMIICTGPTAETAAAVERALELQKSAVSQPETLAAEALGPIPTYMLLAMHVVEGNFRQAHQVAQHLYASEPQRVAPEARAALGLALYGMHQPAPAIIELQRVVADGSAVHGLTVDHVTIAHAILALAFFQTGNLTRAREQYDVALQRARAAEAPLNHSVGLGFLTELHLLAGEWEWASRLASETLAVSTKHDLRSFVGQASFVKGLAAFESGNYEEGLAPMGAALHACRTTAHGLGVPYLSALYGTAQATTGAREAALESLDAGLAWAARSGETRGEAEIHRLKGAILRRSPKRSDQARGLDAVSTAVACARAHGSHLFHLRAAIDLAQLLREKDRRTARQVLREALESIDPENEARELRAARDLVRQLG